MLPMTTKRDLVAGIVLAAILALVVAAATWGGDSRGEGSDDARLDVPSRYADDDASIVAYRAGYGYCRLVPVDEIAAALDVAADPLAVAGAMAEAAPADLRDASHDACLAGFESLEADPLGG